MTDDDILAAPEWVRVRVMASDYQYEGCVVSVFNKLRKPQIRVVIEDDNGRLSIHNAAQLTAI